VPTRQSAAKLNHDRRSLFLFFRMAAHDHYDLKLETLVMERRTRFDADLAELSDDDRRWLAEALHAEPHKASQVRYERQHTGFCREIVVTRKDVERLYRERILPAKSQPSE
jgi:hypothetical protein